MWVSARALLVSRHGPSYAPGWRLRIRAPRPVGTEPGQLMTEGDGLCVGPLGQPALVLDPSVIAQRDVSGVTNERGAAPEGRTGPRWDRD